MKIAIIGLSGAGKSTLARKLGELYKCDVQHLDCVHWLPGWKEQDPEEERRIAAEFLDSHDSWIIEGNYTRLEQKRRLEEADLIVEMLLGSFACFSRVRKRLKKYRGTSRPDMTEGCEEKVDLEFARWVFFDGRTPEKMRHFREIRSQYPDKTVVLRSQKQIDRFLIDQRTHTMKD